jgi:lipid II:glycine glycyltransferase (peptidoglycan interpeptide bridge formation enzyme)
VEKYGFHMDKWPLLETKTVKVDLKRKEAEILAGFAKETRYTLRKRAGWEKECEINNFDGLYEILQASTKRKKLWLAGRREFDDLVKSFGEKCFCITVGKLAGSLVLMHDGIAYYHYAGATKEGNKLDLPYLVVWKAMQEVKKRGCVFWDFEGIYDARWPNKDWKGFSRFKKSFGGKEVLYSGTYIKWDLLNAFG